MSKVAFLGLGAMGSRMATNLLKAGNELTVWNREPEAADKLVAAGAKKGANPREAACASDFVISMLSNDEASRQVWMDDNTGALAGMQAGAIAIESSTLTPAWVRELSEAMKKVDMMLLDAMVSGSTPQAESGELVYLVGGDSTALTRATPVLKAMGSSIQHAGPAGCGALAKLVTNTFMGVELATLAEMIGMLKKQGVDPELILSAVSATALWNPHLTRDTESMLTKNFKANFPIKLVEKDLGYAVKTAGEAELVPIASAARGVFKKAMDANLGDLNMTAVAKLFDREQSGS